MLYALYRCLRNVFLPSHPNPIHVVAVTWFMDAMFRLLITFSGRLVLAETISKEREGERAITRVRLDEALDEDCFKMLVSC